MKCPLLQEFELQVHLGVDSKQVGFVSEHIAHAPLDVDCGTLICKLCINFMSNSERDVGVRPFILHRCSLIAMFCRYIVWIASLQFGWLKFTNPQLYWE